MAESVAIWGAGGHGLVVADVARTCGLIVLGFIDRDRDKVGTAINRHGDTVRWTEEEFMADQSGCLALPGVGDNAARDRILRQAGQRAMGAVVHPAATIATGVSLGRGVVVMAGAVLNPAVEAGDGTIINTAAVVEHETRIGRCVHISPGAILCGQVEVGELTWIGAGAILLPGVRIGSRTIIGAGAVVLGEVPAGVVALGNPARVIRRSNL